jgi:hypothetical protein
MMAHSWRPQLSLLEARVRKRMLGKQVIEPLLDKLGETVHEQHQLKVLSDEIDLTTALWLVGGNLTEQISQFVDAAVQCEKLEELIVQLVARHPELYVDTRKE